MTESNGTQYELTPTQRGMLFHAFQAELAGVDIEQVLIELGRSLQLERWQRAWQAVVDENSILRTAFRVRGAEEPRQEVVREAALPWLHRDAQWLGASNAEQALQRLLEEDRAQPFDFACAPLMRMTTLQLDSGHWVLLWSFHHAILDGRSFALLLADVLERYRALGAPDGEAAPRAVRRPFSDYVRWLGEQDWEHASQFFRERLAGFSAPTPLPGLAPARDAARASTQGFGRLEHRFSRAETQRLMSFCQQSQLSLNTLVQGAWALVLSRGTRERDVVFGATRACRYWAPDADPSRDSRNMVGLFINTLPLRVDVDPEANTLTWLRSLKQQQRSLRPVEHTPLYRIQAWSSLPPGTALFETLVVFDSNSLQVRMDRKRLDLGGDDQPTGYRYFGQTNYPLTVVAYGDDEFLLQLEYHRSRLLDAAAAALFEQLSFVLGSLPSSAAKPLGELALMDQTHAERLHESGRPRSSFATGSLVSAFSDRVTQRPDAVAVSDDGRSLTYRELDERANATAHRLRALGVGRDVLVGLYAERSLELVVGILAILKAGGAYLPLDPSYPAERLMFMLEDAEVRVVLVTHANLKDCVPRPESVALDVVAVDTEQHQPAAPEGAAPGADDLAYVIYTSGSTGRPKGVLVTHRNVCRLFRATQPCMGFREEDVFTLFHSYAFDFSVWELWGALLFGGRLVVVPYWVSREPEAFWRLVHHERVSVLNQTPSAFRQFVQADAAVSDEAAASLALRLVIFGGEALELEALRPWLERHGDRQPRLVNMYGITETTVHVTYRPIGWPEVRRGAGSLIGPPIADLGLHIVDERGRLCPVGVPGEVYVEGAGLARGYLHRPELTEERFVDVALTPNAVTTRMYRSGDLARRLYDGDIEYLGRIDEQVKVRGFRIELGEIEAVISQHHAVLEAAVLARQDTESNKRLVAYIVCTERGEDVIEEVRELVQRRLPSYMVPSAFVWLERFPLTPNGKLDRRALPAPSPVREATKSAVPPRNDAERALAAIWCKVLGVNQVGVFDNFFELGGDSILSVQIISAARELGLHITPRDIFKKGTIAQLVNSAATASELTPAPAVAGPAEGELPLTPIQHWFLEQQLIQPEHYNQSFVFRVAQATNAEHLQLALAAVVEHHDAFRLMVERDAATGNWRSRYAESCVSPVLERLDLSGCSEAEATARQRLAVSELQSQLDPKRARLLRALWIERGTNEENRLALAIHHLAIDGVSWRILMEDLERAYAAVALGDPPRLAPVGASYQAWANALCAYASRPPAPREVAHWSEVAALGREAVQLLPRDAAAHDNTEGSAATLWVELDRERTEALLSRVPRAYRTQVDDSLLTALVAAVSTWRTGQCGEVNVLLDCEGHARDAPVPVDVSRAVGWFTSLFPVVLRLPAAHPTSAAAPASLDVREGLRAIKEQVRRIPQRGFGFGVYRTLAAASALGRICASVPAAQIIFNNLGQLDQMLASSSLFALSDEPAGPWHAARAHRRHALEVTACVQHRRLRVAFAYSQNYHTRGEVEALARLFSDYLDAIIDHCAHAEHQGFTPSDFDGISLSQRELDALVARYPALVDVMPLSPMQTLFHSMEAAGGLGFLQWQFTLHGPVDAAALEGAWNAVIRRHPMLRALVVSEGLSQTVQVVLPNAKIEVEKRDLSQLTTEGREAALSALLREDHQRGLDIAQAPMLRVTLVRTGPESYSMLWSTHHLIVDGWSWPLIFADLSTAYRGLLGEPTQLDDPPSCTYHDYVSWLAEHATGDKSFWRDGLLGVEPMPLDFGDALARAATPDSAPRYASTELSLELTARVREFARRHKVTSNTLVQAAWGALLSHYTGQKRVVMGASFAGRTASLHGVEVMVGPCVNNLPVVVDVDPTASLQQWLERLTTEHAELSQRQCDTLASIYEASGLPPACRLFDTLLVFQNYRGDTATTRLAPNVQIELVSAPEATNYPLTLTVTPAACWGVKLWYQSTRFSQATAENILRHFEMALTSLVDSADPTRSLSAWLAVFPEAFRGISSAKWRGRRQAYVAPESAIERRLSQIWSELFRIEPIGLDDNFFDLGGHSLLLLQAHARIQSELAPNLPVVALLRFPTLRRLATHLSSQAADKLANRDLKSRAALQRAAQQRAQASKGQAHAARARLRAKRSPHRWEDK